MLQKENSYYLKSLKLNISTIKIENKLTKIALKKILAKRTG